MKTMRELRVGAVLLFCTAMGSAVAGRAIAQDQPDGWQEKHTAELAMQEKHDAELAIVTNDGVLEGQDANQRVKLELFAADAQVVKGKPYSADKTTETEQTLADGNRIVHRSVSKFFRDSEGRTRREETFGNVDPDHPSPHEVKIFVDDPESGVAYVMDPASKSVDKVQRLRKIVDDGNAEDDGGRMMFKSARDAEGAEPGPQSRMLIKLRDEHSVDPNIVVSAMRDDKRETVKEELGTKTIEGVECTGTRRTTTIPAGAIGNEKPISIVRETWYAPSIAAVVESTTDDPRYGKTTYQLTNVQLSEPARSLFEPPADFKINGRK